jgi:hypothetical protein
MTNDGKTDCPICGKSTDSLSKHIRGPGGHDWADFEEECL